MNMVEPDGLIDRDLGKNWKDRIEDAKRLGSKTVVSDGRKE